MNLEKIMKSDSVADLIDEVTLENMKYLYELECGNEERVTMQEDKDDSVRMQAHLKAVIEYLSVASDYEEWLNENE